MNRFLPSDMSTKYAIIKDSILQTLRQYSSVPPEKYFYELCFCICTPQSSAKNAFLVQKKLEEIDFFQNEIDVTEILRDSSHYIRFHNQKAKRLNAAKEFFPYLERMLQSDRTQYDKRDWLASNFSGLGMKESSHFLRNIGYRDLAIIDRHLLQHLVNCNVIDQIPTTISKNLYIKIEQDFLAFADEIGMSIDELDILFWSNETGFILK